jgi:hypothetical protein
VFLSHGKELIAMDTSLEKDNEGLIPKKRIIIYGGEIIDSAKKSDDGMATLRVV